MKGEICQIAFAVVFVPAMIFGWLILIEWIRLHRLRRTYRSLSAEARGQILNRIDEAGRANTACTVLVATNTDSDNSSFDIASSHFGGVPYAESGDVWPRVAADRTEPADFLIQIRLDETFPPPWPGRLIVVFNQFDNEQLARCYPSPSVGRSVPLTDGSSPQPEWRLQPVRIPEPASTIDGDSAKPRDGLLSYDPVVLLELVPGLPNLLLPHTNRPADLLAMILAPNYVGANGFELSSIVQVGGKPVWLTDDLGGLDCDHCGREMRFLFQFGDLNNKGLLGDSGVCYVFGCDEHRDQPRAIVQM